MGATKSRYIKYIEEHNAAAEPFTIMIKGRQLIKLDAFNRVKPILRF